MFKLTAAYHIRSTGPRPGECAIIPMKLSIDCCGRFT